MKTNILKINQNSSEEFKKGKIFNEVFGACLSASCLQGEAETIASHVCNQVEAWANQFSEITEDDLRRKTVSSLENYQPDAAYLYQNEALTI